MQIMINKHYYQVWRKRGETATSASEEEST
jgi:hypothetical protein